MAFHKQEIQQQLDHLKTQRDEVHLQIHLAKAEVLAEWHKLEKRYQQLCTKSKQVLTEAADSGSDVLDDLKMAGEDIKSGYQRIRDKLH